MTKLEIDLQPIEDVLLVQINDLKREIQSQKEDILANTNKLNDLNIKLDLLIDLVKQLNVQPEPIPEPEPEPIPEPTPSDEVFDISLSRDTVFVSDKCPAIIQFDAPEMPYEAFLEGVWEWFIVNPDGSRIRSSIGSNEPISAHKITSSGTYQIYGRCDWNGVVYSGAASVSAISYYRRVIVAPLSSNTSPIEATNYYDSWSDALRDLGTPGTEILFAPGRYNTGTVPSLENVGIGALSEIFTVQVSGGSVFYNNVCKNLQINQIRFENGSQSANLTSFVGAVLENVYFVDCITSGFFIPFYGKNSNDYRSTCVGLVNVLIQRPLHVGVMITAHRPLFSEVNVEPPAREHCFRSHGYERGLFYLCTAQGTTETIRHGFKLCGQIGYPQHAERFVVSKCIAIDGASQIPFALAPQNAQSDERIRYGVINQLTVNGGTQPVWICARDIRIKDTVMLNNSGEIRVFQRGVEPPPERVFETGTIVE